MRGNMLVVLDEGSGIRCSGTGSGVFVVKRCGHRSGRVGIGGGAGDDERPGLWGAAALLALTGAGVGGKP